MSGPATQRFAIGASPVKALIPAGCPHCDRTMLAPPAALQSPCPMCARGTLEAADISTHPEPPELLVPFTLDRTALQAALKAWVRPVWFKTRELRDPGLLAGRAVRLWWPWWLVDAKVAARWSGEIGFDYEVQSHVEKYAGGSWTTEAVVETRIRWEPRFGELLRPYDNARVRALSDALTLTDRWIGPTDVGKAVAVTPAALEDARIRIADVDPDWAWEHAQNALAGLAAEEVRQAADADHIRQFSMNAVYSDVNWTWLLCPVWATWYRDDSGTTWVVLVNGQTGSCGGARLASNRKGWLWAGFVQFLAACCAAVGLVILLLGVVLLPLLVVGVIVLALSFVVACLGLWPAVKPWRWNKQQRKLQPPDEG